jgi:hypothetical protein
MFLEINADTIVLEKYLDGEISTLKAKCQAYSLLLVRSYGERQHRWLLQLQ